MNPTGASLSELADNEASDAAFNARVLSFRDHAANETAQVASERAWQLRGLEQARRERHLLAVPIQDAEEALSTWARLTEANPWDPDLPLLLEAAQADLARLLKKALKLDEWLLVGGSAMEARIAEIARAEDWEGRHRARLEEHKSLLAEQRARAAREAQLEEQRARRLRVIRLADEYEASGSFEAMGLDFEDIREAIQRVESRLSTCTAAPRRLCCPVCRQQGCWRWSGEGEQREWTATECSVCQEHAEGGVIDPCLHTLCQGCCEQLSPAASPTRPEARILALGRDPEYARWAAASPGAL